ncbi:MAG: methyltransferase domain-containing protein [Vicinamibacterales bacterium]|nr:methyltransferase domain-containing protein [Vicinamibacterales bacterium]MDP7473089.1 methyltransferase domain-containing protein [Vicinamibacterales bacterium]MDP7670737.1 methyltransferase domain-containing protein [Vicinamibacterales bacterium]HJO38980.1 methyltransferase domain-containing protein [Vicinamibacterales bacterium]
MSGVEPRWDPDEYGRTARFVSDLGADVLALLAPAAGERILDLGCGDGVLSAKIDGLGVEVVAVDSSPEQVAAAHALGLDARVADAANLRFDAEFDAVFSNAALHWVTAVDPWYFPDVADYTRRLEAAGFDVRSAELFDRPTPLAGDIRDWLALFAQPFLAVVAEADRAAVLDDVRDAVRPTLQRTDGSWTADYVRLRVKVLKPG